MRNTKFTATFLTICAVIFGLTMLANAAVKPDLMSQAPNGDYDGAGKADVAIFRPATGDWWGVRSSANSASSLNWGQNGDTPAPAAFVQ